jgi:hypothetical protein
LLPERHIADTGFVNSKLLVDTEQLYGIDVIGPTRDDHHWQAKDGAGFAACDVVIDWEQQQARCPAGKLSNSWTPAIDRCKNEVIKLKWATSDCQACPSRAQCTRSNPPRRTITIRPQAQHEALLAGRARESTATYKTEYAKRAGVEGTIAQSVRSCEVRRSRYVGQERTHLQHVMTAAAMNVVRMLHWLAEVPKAKTRPSAFARLAPRHGLIRHIRDSPPISKWRRASNSWLSVRGNVEPSTYRAVGAVHRSTLSVGVLGIIAVPLYAASSIRHATQPFFCLLSDMHRRAFARLSLITACIRDATGCSWSRRPRNVSEKGSHIAPGDTFATLRPG